MGNNVSTQFRPVQHPHANAYAISDWDANRCVLAQVPIATTSSYRGQCA